MFPVNLVLQMGELRRRLLWCDTELVIWIDIDSSLAFPESASVAELVRIPAKLNSHSGQREHPDP